MSKQYLYFEYAAAKLYYGDVKLNMFIDQAESGLYIENSEWEVLHNPMKDLNFHTLWDELPEAHKQVYMNLARQDLYSSKEISYR